MADPSAPPARSRSGEIDRLRRRLAEIRNSWGKRAQFPKEAERLENLIADRKIAAAVARSQIDAASRSLEELQTKLNAVTAEINGYEAGIEAILRKHLEEATGWAEPMWSPIPVYGFRLWWITSTGLQGATRYVWLRPHLSARCGGPAGTDDGEVPHTDGRCGNPPCGIYALKDTSSLVRFATAASDDGLGVMIGLTALSGKVVEHDEGYRAQHAEVVAAAVFRDGRVITGDSPDWIADLFRDPAGLPVPGTDPPGGANEYIEVIDYLNDCLHQEEKKWTSASRSE